MDQQAALERRRRWLVAFLAASLLFAGYTILCRGKSSLMTMGDYGSDHLSHAHAAVLFYYRGLDIYRRPVNELLQQDDSPRAALAVEQEGWEANELFVLPERARPSVPLFLNWTQLARVYPPGLYIYTLVEGVWLECAEVPLWVISAFSLLKYVVVAHVLLWFLFDYLLVTYSWDETLWGILPGRALLLLLMAAVQVQVCIWAVQGIYDALALLFLVLMVISYKQRQWALVVFYFAVAVFIHFRGLWFLPLAGLAAIQLLREGPRNLFANRRQTVLLLSAAALLAVSAFFFLLAYPAMAKFPLNNPLQIKALMAGHLPWLPLSLIAVLAAFVAWNRDWLLLVCIAGALLFLFNTLQVQFWHALFLVPLLLCSRDISLAGLFRGGLSYCLLSYLFVNLLPISPTWAKVYYYAWP